MASNFQETTPSRKSVKGILKTSISFEKHSSPGMTKSTKFDELNVQATFHPANKDYGHMKIDEPKTPYNYATAANEDQLDAELLAEKLRNTIAKSLSIDSDDSCDENETEEQLQKRREFEKRRKLHYNEFEAVRRARKLMEQDDDDGEDVENDHSNTSASGNGNDTNMDMDDDDDDVNELDSGTSTSSAARH